MERIHIKGDTWYLDAPRASIPFYKLGDGEVVLLDSGSEEDGDIVGHFREHGERVAAVLNTHGHLDHVHNNVPLREAFGAEIVPAKRVMHGKISRITHTESGIFAGMPNPFPAVRYHSLAVREESLPAELEITARSEDGEIMGLRDRSGLAEGVQFHPESVLTEHGMHLIAGFCAKLRNAQGRDVR